MQEPFKESETAKQPAADKPGQVETKGLDESWAITDKVPTVNGTGTLSLFNLLIREQRVSFMVTIPGIGGYEVLEFQPMADKFFISVTCKDKVLDTTLQFVVSHYTTFGIYLKSESWFL